MFLVPYLSGWYKDKNKLDIDSRSDRNKPLYPHPLSLTELEKYGFQALSDTILTHGGPFKVGAMLGIEWREPIRKRRVSLNKNMIEKQKPGQLSLGKVVS